MDPSETIGLLAHGPNQSSSYLALFFYYLFLFPDDSTSRLKQRPHHADHGATHRNIIPAIGSSRETRMGSSCAKSFFAPAIYLRDRGINAVATLGVCYCQLQNRGKIFPGDTSHYKRVRQRAVYAPFYRQDSHFGV